MSPTSSDRSRRLTWALDPPAVTNLRALLIAVSVASGAAWGRGECEDVTSRGVLATLAVVGATVATVAILRMVAGGGDNAGSRKD